MVAELRVRHLILNSPSNHQGVVCSGRAKPLPSPTLPYHVLEYRMSVIAQNRKALHDYAIEDRLEAGICLTGTEVKSVREGRVNLRDSYVIIKNHEAYMLNCHISPYSHGNIMNHDPLRTRKLLLHRREIDKLLGKTNQKGYTLIPLRMYFKGPHIKVEIGLARGKREFEKREAIKEREAKQAIARAMRNR